MSIKLISIILKSHPTTRNTIQIVIHIQARGLTILTEL
jgi:hypothetical protein